MFKSLSKSRDYSCLNVEPGDSCVVAATPSPIHTHTVVVNFQCAGCGHHTLVFRQIERLDLPKMLKSKFQKGVKFLKGHFRIFNINIFIFQPDRGLEKFFKI